jgi:hypothetical protein
LASWLPMKRRPERPHERRREIPGASYGRARRQR